MHLDLRILGREVNDGMLEAIKDFLNHHQYEGEYKISIHKADALDAPIRLDSSAGMTPAATIPSGRIRPRINTSPRNKSSRNTSVNFNLSEDRGEMFSQSGKFKFKRRG
ncbi:MAG: hypothetical protein AAF587_33620 [Bacteroidota bacterium]